MGRRGELGRLLSASLAGAVLPAAPVVWCEGTGRRFGQRWAVRNVDLTVAEGEMMGIVGPDGAGKTTLLQMCAAILDPSEGSCRVFELDSVRASAEITARIGYMSQGFTLYDRLTVLENLRLAAGLRDVSAADFSKRSQALFDMAGLSPFLNRRAGKLSGGMRKKLALCTNLVHEPRLLLLDEPGLGVDPLSRRQLWEMLDRFHGGGTTIVVATSYMDEAERCDRILLMQAGAVLGEGSPAEIRHAAEGRVFEITAPDPRNVLESVERSPGVYGIQVLPDRVRFQSEATPSIPSARALAPTLEDVFVLHTGDREPDTPSMEDPRASAPGHILTSGLTVRFGSFTAVSSVSLEAEPGSLLALIGPNGAGKTTLIRALCGLVPISEGEATISGTRVEPGARRVREQIGYMSQHFSLYADLTLAENLEFFAAAYGMPAGDASESIRWATATTGLTDEDGDRLVSSLSGATRQRLSLACSILHHPSILFLDEPTSGVDPVSRYRFWRLIRSLTRTGMVVVVTTHYLAEAGYCDRIGLMHNGSMIAMGSLPEIRTQTHSPDDAPIEDVFINAIRRARQ